MRLEVQVRSGRVAAAADLGDHLAGDDALPGRDELAVDVAVHGHRAVVAAEVDGQAEAGGRPGALDDAAVGRVHGGADGGSDVHAGVQRAPAPSVAAGDVATGGPDV